MFIELYRYWWKIKNYLNYCQKYLPYVVKKLHVVQVWDQAEYKLEKIRAKKLRNFAKLMLVAMPAFLH